MADLARQTQLTQLAGHGSNGLGLTELTWLDLLPRTRLPEHPGWPQQLTMQQPGCLTTSYGTNLLARKKQPDLDSWHNETLAEATRVC